jgi:hypothetical protein
VPDHTLHFISIEGNWDKEIQDKRIAQAAMILEKNKSSLAIASATYAPPSYSSFFEGRLGEYTKDILINKYGIPAMRIIPAYLFPYPSTYTIIDAFVNAALTGWISCGLRKRSDPINVLLEPVTSEFHGLRVETLNNRACQYLRDFNVNLELLCRNKLPLTELEKEYPEEVVRLSQLQSEGGLIATGEWNDNGRARSYDDLKSMKQDLSEAFKSVFKFPLFDMDTSILSDSGRLIITLLWNHIANSKKLTDRDIETICLYAQSDFNSSISDSEMLVIKSIISKITNIL